MESRPDSARGASSAARAAPWAEEAGEVARRLGVDVDRGLTRRETERRLRVHGPNRLRRVRRRSPWRILVDQLAGPIAALLGAAAGAAFLFDEPVEGAAIVAALVLNATIGFTTERRAVRSMEALRELGRTEATVRRDGQAQRVPAEVLVPGDVVVLEAGDVSTADVRLLSSSRLEVDESALTGESLPVEKDVAPVASGAALDERTCMLFKGTAVTRGACEGVVVATGMATELGHISSLVEEAAGAATPLEKRLDRLARRLIGLTLVIAVLAAAAVVVSGRGMYLAVETGIALAIAAIPEGLPIVATVALARGMWRMARRNALVENLAAVETLGSTTLVLTDKTGTLTENRMTVVELELAGGRVRVEGTGLSTRGRFLRDDRPLDVNQDPELAEALRVAVLCNDATLTRSPDGAPAAVGDPTEVALLVAGAKAGLERDELLRAQPEIGEVAFDSETKRMATLHRADGGVLVAVKGAPETVLETCATVRAGEGARPMDDAERAAWMARAGELASSGERVLALATARVDSADAFAFERLRLSGLIGLLDPPRESARRAVEAFRGAGIRVAMVTGDHGATAWTVAAAVGLVHPLPGAPPAFLDARALPPPDELSDDEVEALCAAPVIARASPSLKLDLIARHQRRGEIVAMTGDGVNDAPALEKADIGVAMGLRGTQVAREAADMVLKDDELVTIVTAVGEGRAIFANIRKFVVYLMSCNVSEIFVVGLGSLVPGPLPLLPLQILFLNLVTDVFPALALGVCEGSPELLREPPRDPREPMLTRGHWRGVFALGAVMAVSVLAALLLAVVWLGRTDAQATTVAFTALALAQLWHVFSMRNVRSRPFRNEVTRNPWVWGAVALCLALVVLAVRWSPLARVLSTSDPGPAGWALAVAASLVPLVAGQLALRVERRRRARTVRPLPGPAGAGDAPTTTSREDDAMSQREGDARGGRKKEEGRRRTPEGEQLARDVEERREENADVESGTGSPGEPQAGGSGPGSTGQKKA